MRYSPLVLLLAATPVAAQSTARAVRGVVFDPIARAPLPGAVVQVSPTDSAAAGRVFSSVADSAGRFRVAGLAPGHYVIGFQHKTLISLGIESPVKAFDVGSDSVVTVDLATPPADALRAARCGAGDPRRPGMLIGTVSDARRGKLPSGAQVEVQWTELGLRERKLQAIPFLVTAPVDDDGSFVACNLTTEANLAVVVTAPAHRALEGEILVPASGVLQHDFTLADTSRLAGTSRVTGRVVLADGRPLPSGTATIPALGLEAPVTEGRFNISGVPAGTWLVESRAVGYEQQSVLVDVADGTPASLSIKLNTRAQVLDAVSVVGKSNNKEIGVLMGIQERARLGSGTVFGPGSDALKTATFPADVVRFARGFKYISATEVQGRNSTLLIDSPKMVCANAGCTSLKADGSLIGQTAPNEPCTSVREGVKKRYLVLYLDGERFNGGLDMLNTTIAMNEILAIEAYPDVASAPPIFRTADACAVIAVWQKH